MKINENGDFRVEIESLNMGKLHKPPVTFIKVLETSLLFFLFTSQTSFILSSK